jgi:hypothetical protein
MEDERSPHQPRYFLAHFGQKYAQKHPVNGGCYPVPSWNKASHVISQGDLLLLCCWGGHKSLFGGAAWGIGEVTHKKQHVKDTAIYYEPKPLLKAVERATIDACLTQKARGNFKMGPVRGWAFLSQIESSSFQCIVGPGYSAGYIIKTPPGSGT